MRTTMHYGRNRWWYACAIVALGLAGLPLWSARGDAPPAGKAPTFERDVLPVLTRAGCNAGACHGKARGQGGFALSLLGYDPAADHAAIVSEGRGRRLFPAAPEHSLLLRKAAAITAHGGGRRLPTDKTISVPR